MEIREYMTNEHRECDEILSEVENIALEDGLDKVGEKFQEFCDEMERHFLEEENVMFPEFESKTGMTQGPTQVMKMEHNMIRQSMIEMKNALKDNNKDRFLGLIESVNLLTQQHNMKEEQMLYNMVQMHLGEQNDEIIDKMKDVKVG